MKLSLPTLFLALTLGFASADVPDGMTYQGVLTDNAGGLVAPATPENREIEFRIYSQPSGGVALWGETQTVTVFQGNFSVVLGNGASLGGGVASGKPALASTFADGTGTTFFFGITPAGGNEFVPRQGILSSAFAFRSKVSESVNGDFLKTVGNRLGVGIGNTATPEAVLHTGGKIFIENSQVGNPVNSRTGGNGTRLTLWPGNSSNTPYALGIGSGTLWSGVPANAQHAWYIGTTRRMFLNSNQLSVTANINSTGSITSTGSMTSGGNVSTKNWSVVNSDGDTQGGVIFGIGSGENIRSVATSNDLRFTTNHGERMTITSDGKVGIGTRTPGARFHVLNSGTNMDSVYFQSPNRGGNTSHIHNGNNGDIYWRSASGAGKVILQDTGGRVGIGTSSPSRGRVHIAGFTNDPIGAYRFYNKGGAGDAGAATVSLSLYGDLDFGARQFLAFSDERIKNVEGRSSSSRDLESLLALEVTDYTYIDKVKNGNIRQKKLIAQQVEKVYPLAVNLSSNVIPDIFKNADLSDGWISLETDLRVGEKVRIISEESDQILKVLEVKKSGFKVDFPVGTEPVFVYGREVQDFRNVDYQAISMLNVSATQEMHRQMTVLEKKVAQLEAREEARDTRVEALEKALLALTADKKSGE